MQELSRVVELFDSPATDLRRTRHPLEPPHFKVEPIDSASWQDTLSRIIEAEIIPRLLLSNLTQQQIAPSPITLCPDLGTFIKLLLDADTSTVLSFVRRLQCDGMPLEAILLDLLGGASRYLGALWETDHCDFLEVITGLHRLHRILLALTPVADAKPTNGHRVMFLTAPDETHDFGVTIVETFFRGAGWQTKRCLEQDHIAALRSEHYDVVGFSLSCHRYLDGLIAAVNKARQVSKNSSIKILVGGVVFLQNPELIRAVGADGSAIDAPGAVLTAESLLNDYAFV